MSNATFTWNGKSHSLLSETTAMACHSFALLAGSSCPGAVANSERDICTGCYAQIGMYAQNSVEAAQAARFAWTMWMIANDPAAWVDIMVHAIKATGEKYFRWHDSGDIQGLWHLQNIVEVARRLPDVRFWIPTRENRVVREYLRDYGNFPTNLIVRVSAAMIGGKPIVSFPHTSTVVSDGSHTCPAYRQAGMCGDCRACWSTESHSR